MAEKPILIKPLEDVVPIAKPSAFDLDKFKSKRAAAVANVETLANRLAASQHFAGERLRPLHPEEENYWSPELCFVSVPIKGQKRDTLHLIEEDLAMQYLPSGRIQRFRLALASKPHDVFFLCHVPTRNTDNQEQSGGLRTGEKPVGAGHQPPLGECRRLQGRLRARAGCFPGTEMANAVAR
jgi:hypothetical protein